MDKPNARRNFLNKIGISVAALMAAPMFSFSKSLRSAYAKLNPDSNTDMNPILNIRPLGFQWETADPFLFCVHHEDYFPKGNDEMGPEATHFQGRHIGDDFIIKDGFRMYHGKTVPGFPGHPHRGFETITVVRKGIVDHADSLGAAGRYGNGDVQWMTAGKGVQHSEMFPLIQKEAENPLELFQIWLNLPAKDKMVNPYFRMLWRETIPNFIAKSSNGASTKVEVIAGKLDTMTAAAPPPDSWAADPHNEVAVWNIKMEKGATWTLPKASAGINRTIYFYEGETLDIAGTSVSKYCAVTLKADVETTLTASSETSILMLQGRPIGEPVMQYGPFVMNTKEEINQAFEDYHKTQFGGWPWSRYDQVHDRSRSRFAKHSDGREEVQEG
jgi:quercetin 2,3-dioxygenase